MKILILLLTASQLLLAQSALDIFAGYDDGILQNAKVKSSKWLSNIENFLEREYDFHENASYTGEDWGSVESYCNYTEEESEFSYEHSDLEYYTKWNKIVTKDGKSVAYILYLMVELIGCDYPRGIYVVNKSGKEILADDLYSEFGIDWFYFLESTYIK